MRAPAPLRRLARAFAFSLLVAAGAGAAVAQTPAAPAGLNPPALESLFGGPFTLVDQDGVERTDRDFRGRYMLIYFGYTYCPVICPANLHHMAVALKELGDKADRIVPVFITVDPGRDTPEVLKDYVGSFGPSFVGLTGSEEQVRAAAKAYRVHRRKVVPEGYDAKDYLVDHASTTYLVGPDGTFVTLFPHDTPGDVMAERIARYLEAPAS